MTSNDVRTGASTNAALRRVVERVGGPGLLNLLADEISGADLTTLLLEVYRRRAQRLSPSEVMRRYRADRFVAPSPISFAALRRVEDRFVAALPEDFDVLVLAPVLPLAAQSTVSTVDPRKVIATVRGSEVAADPTNALALEAAVRRAESLADDPHSSAPIRLAASQRVTRAQRFEGAGMLAHFQLFGLVTAGRDTGSRSFEQEHLAEHLRFAVHALTAAGAHRTQIRLTILDEAARPDLEQARRAIGDLPAAELLEDPHRSGGRGYYAGLCFKIFGEIAGELTEIGDGGLVDWTQLLTGNRKERLLISGYGLERLATVPLPRT